MESFWAACETRGPLILEVEEQGDSRSTRYAFDRPCVLIGSGSRSDLRLDQPEVSRRHAYLQVIAGHLFCVDLDSRTGTFLAGSTPSGGWVFPDRPIQIGTAQIWVRSPHPEAGRNPVPGFDPSSIRATGLAPGATTTLIVEGGRQPRPIAIRRTLTLIGRSERCKIRLNSPRTSRFSGALLQTPQGVWVIDLRSTGCVSVNGARLDSARIADGDELRVGPFVARVHELTDLAAPARPEGARSGLAVLDPVAPGSTDLRPFLEQVVGIQRQSSDQFGQVVLMLTQMFGNMHREMVDLVREELEQIRRLAAEIQTLRADPLAEEDNRQRGQPPTPPPIQARGTPGKPSQPDLGVPPKPSDPGEVHLFVSERLAAFEIERQSRWNKISKILLKTNP